MKYVVTLALLCLSTLAAAQLPVRGENYYCAKGDVWTGGQGDGPAALPIRCIYTALDGTPSPGAVTVVPAGADVNAALAAAACGDTLELTAGATYKPFTLPAKGCDANHWITIRSNAPDSALPPEHSRINPSYAGVGSLPGRPAYAGGSGNVMATVLAARSVPAISEPTTGVANYYRLGPGLEITRTPGTGIVYQLIALGPNSDHIIFDRDWLHGSEVYEETEVGVFLGGATYVAVVNSYMNDFKCLAPEALCSDSKAIAGGDGILPHPEGVWKAYNDFLEAAGENILHGGGLHGNNTPTDLEYRGNHFFKPLAWANCTVGVSCYIIKNLFECKNCDRVLLEGNRMEGSYGGYSQRGFAVLLTPRGAWANDDNITIRYNYISHTGSALSLAATRTCKDSYLVHGVCPTEIVDSGSASRYSIHDIVMDDIDPDTYRGGGNTQLISQFEVNEPQYYVKLNHLTIIAAKTLIFSIFANYLNPQPQMGPITIKNSIWTDPTGGGVWSSGGTNPCVKLDDPVTTFTQCFTSATILGNVFVGWNKPNSPVKPWPAGNFTPADPTTVFVNYKLSGGDYHVVAPYKGAGTDGRDIGADIDTINAWLAGVE